MITVSKGRPQVLLAVVLATISLLGGLGVSTPSIASMMRPRPEWLLEPVSVKDRVLVAYGNPTATRIAAYDANGRLRWQKQIPRGSFSGELQACEDLVCAPAFQDGVYVFGTRDGSLKAHLLPKMVDPIPLVACTRWRVYIRAFRGHIPAVVAFDTTSFRQAWMREFPEWNVWYLRARADAVVVTIAKGTMERPYGDQLVVLRAKEGRQLSVGAKAPGMLEQYQWERLSSPVRAQMTRLFVRRHGNETDYLPQTPIVRMGQLLAVGRGHETGAVLFCIRADSGRIVWQREAPGLVRIVRVRDRLVVLCAVPDAAYPDSAKRLDWLDFRTGQLLESVRLGGGSGDTRLNSRAH